MVGDDFPPEAPTEPEIIPIGDAELEMSRALDELVKAFDHVERTAMALARACDQAKVQP